MRLLLFVTFTFVFSSLRGQSSDEAFDTYLDADHQRTKDSLAAKFYQTLEPRDEGFVVRTNFFSGKLQMYSECSKVELYNLKSGPNNTVL
ncbi:MAG TPA: hypothetical protein VEB86_03275 [Chryseosolibacter sp.]|nr:hypothetical protein [Chryseosolibacter sp.]